ncbi:MAG: phosphoribosylaminoimidazolesuccinocarboxamide synthase [Ignavibacteriaceae bacterium]
MEILTNSRLDAGKLEISFTDNLLVGKTSKARVKNLGAKLLRINSFFFDYLIGFNVPSAFEKVSEEAVLIFDEFDKLDFHVKIQNLVSKKNSKIFGLKEFSELNIPLYEFYLDKEEKFLLSDSHLNSFGLLGNEDYKMILRICSKINAVLKSFFERRGYIFASVNCIFGKLKSGKLVMIGDFSPFSIKIIDANDQYDRNFAFNLKSGVSLNNYADLLNKLIIINDKV